MSYRVLFCDGYPAWGGVQRWMHSMACDLVARGWQVTVAGRPDSEVVGRAQSAGLPTLAWPLKRHFDVPSMLAAHRYFRRSRPDVLVVGLGRDIRTVGPVARMHGVPIVWRVGEYTPCGWTHRFMGKGMVNCVIAVTEHLRSYLEERDWLKGKVAVVPNGVRETHIPTAEEVQAARDAHGWSRDAFIVLYVGRLVGRKGADFLVNALAVMKDTHPMARLVLVGTGRFEPLLRELADAHGLTARVEFAGYRRDTSSYYTGCDLVAVPSRREVFGQVLLEAMALAKPIVAARVGGIPEVVGESGAILVPRADPEALAEAIAVLIDDPARRRRLGLAGHERVRAHFQESEMLDRVAAELTRVITTYGRARRRHNESVASQAADHGAGL